MRAYFTIIKDAFAAAVASKLLYVMLGLIVIFLLAISPLSYTEALNYQLGIQDLRDPQQIAIKLVKSADATEPSMVSQFWQRLPEPRQTRLSELVEQVESDTSRNQMVEAQRLDQIRMEVNQALNLLIKDLELASPDLVDREQADEELLELLDLEASSRSQDQSRRLNRLLIDYALPFEVAQSSQTMLRLTYFGMIPVQDFGPTRVQLKWFASFWIPWLLDKFVLSLGVLVAILFTANMIPELLEPGSLNLLLSKPVRRSGLLFAKFIGACAFALLNSSVLFIGIWLLLGLRMGIWNEALLACIPIYVFVFALYFSVSTFVGLLTRSTILSIVAAILFWLFSFLIGFGDQTFSEIVMESTQTRRMVVDQDRLIRFNAVNQAMITPTPGAEWQTGFAPTDMQGVPEFVQGMMPMSPMLGPVYDVQGERWVGARGGFATANTPFASNRSIVTASAGTDWKATPHQLAPPFAAGLYPLDEESCVIVTHFGEFYRLKYTEISEPVMVEPLAADGAVTVSVDSSSTTPTVRSASEPTGAESEDLASQDDETSAADMAPSDEGSEVSDDDSADVPSGIGQVLGDTLDAAFTDVSPYERITNDMMQATAYDPVNRTFVFYGSGVITVVSWNGERFDWSPEQRFQLPVDSGADRLTTGGGHAFAAIGSKLFVMDLKGRQYREQELKGTNIKQLEADPKGQGAAFLDSDKNLRLVGVDGAIRRGRPRSQGKLTSLTVSPDGNLWVIDRYCDSQQINWETGRAVASGPSGATFWTNLYRYGIHPIYSISPKPGEFYVLVRRLSATALSENSADENSEGESEELSADQVDSRSGWSPLINGLCYILLFLGLSMLVFERLDF